MQNTRDLYSHAEGVTKGLLTLKNRKDISDENRKSILTFCQSTRANGISDSRCLQYLSILPAIAVSLRKDFKKATREDIERVLIEFEGNHAPQTMRTYRAILKTFFKFLNGGEEYPPSVRWLHVKNGSNNNHRLPEELLTEAEILKLIEACDHQRDKALIALLYESGCRVGELLTLQIKHVTFEDDLTKVIFQGKTGMRKVAVIDCTPHLAAWLSIHPDRKNPDAYIWTNISTHRRGAPLSYQALNKHIRRIAAKAGITKKVNPHSFRHARATVMANSLKEAQLKEYFGWTQGSDVAATYVHLSGRDIDDAVLQMHGRAPKNKAAISPLAPKRCPRCLNENPSTGKFCSRCGLVLDQATAIELQEKQDERDVMLSSIMEDKEVANLIREKIRQFEK